MEAIAVRRIAASPERVAAVMFDARRDPEWIGGAKSVDPPQGSATAIGAKATRHGGFLGWKFSWTTEVAEHVPGRLLRMRFVEGPMKGGDVSYHLDADGNGSRVSITNRAPGPQIMAWFVMRSVTKDLNRPAAIVEQG